MDVSTAKVEIEHGKRDMCGVKQECAGGNLLEQTLAAGRHADTGRQREQQTETKGPRMQP
jgi:hypothetical protein